MALEDITAQTGKPQNFTEISLAFFRELLFDYKSKDFAIRFWDGTLYEPGGPKSANFTFILNHPSSLRRIFPKPSLVSFATAYIEGYFEIEGDIHSAISFFFNLAELDFNIPSKLKLFKTLRKLPASGGKRLDAVKPHIAGSVTSRTRVRDAIQFHYDLPVEFYRLMLDKRMVYSCAYFKSVDEDLDTAQANKLDYICRKLDLRQGDKFLDMGCGWGALVIHAVEHYNVNALGVSLSEKQVSYARDWIAKKELTDRCRVELLDYRYCGELGTFDKAAGVGSIEHGDLRMKEAYFSCANKYLKPGGFFFTQGITKIGEKPNSDGAKYFKQYLFPDADLISISKTLEIAEKFGFEVRDVENLREHYFLTTQHWLDNFEANIDSISDILSEPIIRAFRAYLAGICHSFKMNIIGLYQTLLRKTGDMDYIPVTREKWYM